MTALRDLLILIPVAYCLGSIPFGLVVGLTRGVDPRKSGSGNIGATNVGRLLGGRYFALVFALDVIKGLLPMLAAGWLLGWHAAGASLCLLWIAVGLAAILGHMFSLYLKFKGGKGVATSTGVALGLFPYYTGAAIIAAGVFLICFKFSRYVSLASIAGATAFPVVYIAVGAVCGWPIFTTQWPLLFFSLLVAALIILKHRANIVRLLAGTENRAGKKTECEIRNAH